MSSRRGACCGCLLVALIAFDPAVADEALGRLFFSAAERAELDARRAAANQPPPVAVEPPVPVSASEDVPDSAAALPPALTVNGVVSRSQGPATVWLNGVAQDPRQARVPGVSSLAVTRDTVVVRFEGTQPAQRLRAGETFAPDGSATLPDATREDVEP